MKKILITNPRGVAVVSTCLKILTLGIILFGCTKDSKYYGSSSFKPDDSGNCLSIFYICQSLFDEPDTAYYSFGYLQVNISKFSAQGYFKISAYSGFNDFEIQIKTDSLRLDSSYQSPLVRFQNLSNDATNLYTYYSPFVVHIDSLDGNKFSGSFSGELFDYRLMRPVAMYGNFTNAVLQ